jgi:hypothetical protein
VLVLVLVLVVCVLVAVALVSGRGDFWIHAPAMQVTCKTMPSIIIITTILSKCFMLRAAGLSANSFALSNMLPGPFLSGDRPVAGVFSIIRSSTKLVKLKRHKLIGGR